MLNFYECFRFLIIPTRLVVEGGLISMYGMVWAMCTCGTGVMCGLIMPLMPSMSAWALLKMMVYSNFLDCDFVWEPSDEVDY